MSQSKPGDVSEIWIDGTGPRGKTSIHAFRARSRKDGQLHDVVDTYERGGKIISREIDGVQTWPKEGVDEPKLAVTVPPPPPADPAPAAEPAPAPPVQPAAEAPADDTVRPGHTECTRCVPPVAFDAMTQRMAERFKARHDEVIHNIPRENDIARARENTQRKERNAAAREMSGAKKPGPKAPRAKKK